MKESVQTGIDSDIRVGECSPRTSNLHQENERKLHENRIVMKTKTCHKFPPMRHVIIFNLSLLVHYFLCLTSLVTDKKHRRAVALALPLNAAMKTSCNVYFRVLNQAKKKDATFDKVCFST
jgi:hypothetical protein